MSSLKVVGATSPLSVWPINLKHNHDHQQPENKTGQSFQIKGSESFILSSVYLPPMTKNILGYVWHLLAQANKPSRTHIGGNEAKFKSQWGSYEENQTAVFSSVGMTGGEPGTIQLLARAQRKPISPDLLWEWRQEQMVSSPTLFLY